MTGNLFRMLFIAVMVIVIVSVDVLFLRHHFTARLIVNIGIVVVFAILYFIFFKKS
jgi:type IV secretory pathway VirB2 component (pilin)